MAVDRRRPSRTRDERLSRGRAGRRQVAHRGGLEGKRGVRSSCASATDESITRLLRTANLYSQHDAATTLDELQHDAMTLRTLEGSGVDFLVRHSSAPN